MALYPGASQRLLGSQSEPRITPDLIILHTMAGSLAGTDAYFRAQGFYGLESHFGLGGGGALWQWQDTGRQADANADANDNAISIETEDKNSAFFKSWAGSDVPAWTEAQLDALAHLLAWLSVKHNIPLQMVPDSKSGRRGVAWHRIGIDGNFPALPSIQAGRRQRGGGEYWSPSFGKVCPGNRRVAQIPGLINRARGLVGEDPVAIPVYSPQDPGELLVDGILGYHSIGRWQQDAGTIVDHKISDYLVTRTYGSTRRLGSVGRSMLIAHEQARLGSSRNPDGNISTPVSPFVKALQRNLTAKGYYSGKIDGWLNADGSLTIKGLQRALNDGKF